MYIYIYIYIYIKLYYFFPFSFHAGIGFVCYYGFEYIHDDSSVTLDSH